MLEIVLSICLIAEPSECRDEHVPIFEQASPVYICTKGAVQVIVDWADTHPRWKVVRWRCHTAPTKDA